jgi:hypothetical protein
VAAVALRKKHESFFIFYETTFCQTAVIFACESRQGNVSGLDDHGISRTADADTVGAS